MEVTTEVEKNEGLQPGNDPEDVGKGDGTPQRIRLVKTALLNVAFIMLVMKKLSPLGI